VFNVKSASWAAATDARCPTDSTTRALLARSPAQLIKAITSALVNLPLFRPGSDVSRRLPAAAAADRPTPGPKYTRARRPSPRRPSLPSRRLAAVRPSAPTLWQAFVCLRTVALEKRQLRRRYFTERFGRDSIQRQKTSLCALRTAAYTYRSVIFVCCFIWRVVQTDRCSNTVTLLLSTNLLIRQQGLRLGTQWNGVPVPPIIGK